MRVCKLLNLGIYSEKGSQKVTICNEYGGCKFGEFTQNPYKNLITFAMLIIVDSYILRWLFGHCPWLTVSEIKRSRKLLINNRLLFDVQPHSFHQLKLINVLSCPLFMSFPVKVICRVQRAVHTYVVQLSFLFSGLSYKILSRSE